MDVKGVEYVIDLLVENLHGQKIDKVVGMESRGFFFGMLLAQRLGAGFVPVRKKGKLPYKTLSQTYNLEYGKMCSKSTKMPLQKMKKVPNSRRYPRYRRYCRSCSKTYRTSRRGYRAA